LVVFYPSRLGVPNDAGTSAAARRLAHQACPVRATPDSRKERQAGTLVPDALAIGTAHDSGGDRTTRVPPDLT
jgi:hypothetical protein